MFNGSGDQIAIRSLLNAVASQSAGTVSTPSLGVIYPLTLNQRVGFPGGALCEGSWFQISLEIASRGS
jgi:hypothetical protein